MRGGMAAQIYYRRWEVWLGDQMLGVVVARTEQAACRRAIRRFRIGKEQQAELRVRRIGDVVSAVGNA
jgi:hypothetical protein